MRPGSFQFQLIISLHTTQINLLCFSSVAHLYNNVYENKGTVKFLMYVDEKTQSEMLICGNTICGNTIKSAIQMLMGLLMTVPLRRY